MVAKRRHSKAPSDPSGPDERKIIELLASALGRRTRNARVGIGDDAAVLDLGAGSVWSIDTCVEGVHFRREWLTLEQAARRSFHAAVSDLAAMGARPVAALSSLILPAGFSEREIVAIGRGQANAARELACPVVGGNISRGNELSITLSVIGRAKSPLLRSTAKVGDELWLVGSVGQARAGLLSFIESPFAKAGSKAARTIARCRDTWVYPRARLTEGIALGRVAHAAIDVSDGLARDAGHLALESGVKIVIDAALLESTLSEELCDAAQILGRKPLALALEGGEDYALLATGPRAKRPPMANVIGAVRRGKGAVLKIEGREQALPSGFDHFRS